MVSLRSKTGSRAQVAVPSVPFQRQDRWVFIFDLVNQWVACHSGHAWGNRCEFLWREGLWSSIIYRIDDPQKGGMAFFFFSPS